MSLHTYSYRILLSFSFILPYSSPALLQSAQLSQYSDQAKGWAIRGSNPSSRRFLSRPKRPHRLWDPPSLLFCSLPRWSCQDMRLTTDLELVLRLRMCGVLPPLSLYAFTKRMWRLNLFILLVIVPDSTFLCFFLPLSSFLFFYSHN
jgi:hypothetical protein